MLTSQTENLKNEFIAFNDNQQKSIQNIKNVTGIVKEHSDKFDSLGSLLNNMKLVKDKAIKIKTQFDEILKSATKKLQVQVENGINFLKYFFKKHGAKVFVGGTCGAGLGLTIAILVSLNPPCFILFVTATTVIGTSCGGGMGLTSDMLKAKKNKTSPLKQSPPVAPRPKTVISPKTPLSRGGYNIWKNHAPVTIEQEIETVANKLQPT